MKVCRAEQARLVPCRAPILPWDHFLETGDGRNFVLYQSGQEAIDVLFWDLHWDDVQAEKALRLAFCGKRDGVMQKVEKGSGL